MKSLKIKLSHDQLVHLYTFLQVAAEWEPKNGQEKIMVIILTRLFLKVGAKTLGPTKITLKPEEAIAFFEFYNSVIAHSLTKDMMPSYTKVTLDTIRNEVHQTYLI